MRRPWIGLIVLFATPWPVIAEEPELPGLKLDFPDVEGFRLDAPHVFPQAGSSIPVPTRRLLASVYVYSKGVAEVPTGVKSAVVKKRFSRPLTTSKRPSNGGFTSPRRKWERKR
jgi:hypothetical protein